MLAFFESVSALDLWMFPLSPCIYPAFCRILRIGILRNAVNSLDVRDAKASSPADEASPCQHMIAVLPRGDEMCSCTSSLFARI